jgi:single-stranded DNA-binding protein
MAYALITGRIWKTPQVRLGKTGKEFATVTVHEPGDDGGWWSVIAFGELGGELSRFEEGDAVSISGPFTAEIYTAKSNEPRINFRITAEHIASPRLRRTKPKRGRDDPPWDEPRQPALEKAR